LKIVYSDPKTGRTAQAEISSEIAVALNNKKIGDTIDGMIIGLSGYTLKITGGSDTSGFPMQANIEGTVKKSVLKTISNSGSMKGMHRRRTLVGNSVGPDTAQLNLAILEYGDKSIDEIMPKKEKGKKPDEKKE
jgi:small subunit ribosomal protein S6e